MPSHRTQAGPEEQPESSSTLPPTTVIGDTTDIAATTGYGDMNPGNGVDIRAQCTITLTQSTSLSTSGGGSDGASSPAVVCGGLSTPFGSDTVVASVSTGFARQI